MPETSTHLHNFHSGPESDGGPRDPQVNRFFGIGKFYDYFYTMARAGFDTDEFRATNGDIRETLGTLWYHGHRVDHTAENTYKEFRSGSLPTDGDIELLLMKWRPADSTFVKLKTWQPTHGGPHCSEKT